MHLTDLGVVICSHCPVPLLRVVPGLQDLDGTVGSHSLVKLFNLLPNPQLFGMRGVVDGKMASHLLVPLLNLVPKGHAWDVGNEGLLGVYVY